MPWSPATAGFNEAAGIHRRKPWSPPPPPMRSADGFNEAAGIHRRKQDGCLCPGRRRPQASMRPPEFTGGNSRLQAPSSAIPLASMRPPEFTGGNLLECVDADRHLQASMRPPEFTGGNPIRLRSSSYSSCRASMRPPEFTGGNRYHLPLPVVGHAASFNEAAGIHRRKRGPLRGVPAQRHRASMRPPEFTGGNLSSTYGWRYGLTRFNEAAGIHRRKPAGTAMENAAEHFELQ